MIKQIANIPATMVGFEAQEEMTRADFTIIIVPAVKELIQRTGQLNFLLILDAEFESLNSWLLCEPTLPLFKKATELKWKGPTPSFTLFTEKIKEPKLLKRAGELASKL